MNQRSVTIFFLAVLGWLLLAGSGDHAFGQGAPQDDYIAAARSFLQSAQNGWIQAQQLCSSLDCGPDVSAQVDSLGNAVIQLSSLLNQSPPNIAAIRAAVAGMSSLVQSVCAQLGGQCDVPILGLEMPAMESGIDTGEPQESPIAAAMCTRCPNMYQQCITRTNQQHTACVQSANKLFNCWQRVPFCDWPGFPFDTAAFLQDCQSVIDAGLIPSCRCDCPQSERQGGCPQFFATGTMCSTCSNEACERGGDPRCSCDQSGATTAGWNSVQCDLCRWGNVGFAVSELRRNLFCEKPYHDGADQCSQRYLDCIRDDDCCIAHRC